MYFIKGKYNFKKLRWEKARMDTLQPELLTKIFVHLDLTDIEQSSKTCKLISQICRSDYLWKCKVDGCLKFFNDFEAPSHFIKFVIDDLELSSINILPFLLGRGELGWLKFPAEANCFCERYDIWDDLNDKSIYLGNVLVKISLNRERMGVEYYYLDFESGNVRELNFEKGCIMGVGKVVKVLKSYENSCLKCGDVYGITWKERQEIGETEN